MTALSDSIVTRRLVLRQPTERDQLSRCMCLESKVACFVLHATKSAMLRKSNHEEQAGAG